MGTTKTIYAIDPEGVVPDHPATAVEADFLGLDLQLGSVFVADGKPKRPIGFERSVDSSNPLSAPSQVVLFLFLVIVNIVLVADVERRVRKDKVDGSLIERLEKFDAIALM